MERCHRERIYGDFLEGGMLIVVFCLSTDIANGGAGRGGWINFWVIPKYRRGIPMGIVCALIVVVVVVSNYFLTLRQRIVGVVFLNLGKI